jgi:hypothetical protein
VVHPVLRHELLAKATGVHCAVLARSHVVLCAPGELPPLDPATAVLLFPAGAYTRPPVSST